jgi:N-acetylmuramoyl-L-alanine amidase
MIFNSAGHSPYASNKDFGAAGCGYKEGILAIEFRDLINSIFDSKGVKYTEDLDTETLSTYLQRIQTGNASVVVEHHFNAFNGTASGIEVVVSSDADRLDKAFAKELCDAGALILGIPNRGVKSEGQSARGRLGLMRKQGIVALTEICFIDNCEDMKKYQANKQRLAEAWAEIIFKYEYLIK